MKLERFWTIYARSYDQIWDSAVTAATRAFVHDGIGEAATVVDLGCGTGLLSAGLGVRGIEVIGVDSSVAMLARALEGGRITRAVHAAADAVPLEPRVAGAVIIGNLLHLHPDPAAVVSEARRLLKPGGVIVATWPVPGLTPEAMWRADRHAGRSLIDTLRAQLLRLRVGMLAARTEGIIAARAGGAHDSGSLLSALGLDSSHHIVTVAECQQAVIVLP